MHGLIFVTWEKFLAEKYSKDVLDFYRKSIADTTARYALASRVYEDAILLRGVSAASRATGVHTNELLRQYGRYFMNNSLTDHLCAYLLSQAQTAQDLLLAMRDAHAQMRNTSPSMAPPIFGYATYQESPSKLLIKYDSHRQLCPVLYGCIEGAADRFHEAVIIQERSCMQHGAPACLMEARFEQKTEPLRLESLEMSHKQSESRWMDSMVLQLLPMQGGYTLKQVNELLQAHPGVPNEQVRPSAAYNSISHLQHAGLVASTADRGDVLLDRRYWRVG